MKKILKQILENQAVLNEKLDLLLKAKGVDVALLKTVNPTVPPPKPPEDDDNDSIDP